MFGFKKTVVDVTEANFQKEILEYSRKKPVLVDFWATWCQPCRTLGPLLEKMAKKYDGAFRLAKVDIDANQNLAMVFRVQSVPTVVVVYQEQLVDQFMGAISPADLQRFVEGVLRLTGAGLAEESPSPRDPRQAEAHWRAKLQEDEKDSQAILELGRILVYGGRPEEARGLLQKVAASQEGYDDAQALLSLLDLLNLVQEAGGDSVVRDRLTSNPEDESLRYLWACAEAGHGRHVEALEVLIDLVAKSRNEIRDDAKRAAAVVFSVAGRGDEAVESLRRRLASLLF